MPSDLFILNAMPANPSNAIQNGRPGFFAKAQFPAKAQLPDRCAAYKPREADHKSFAATLRKVSQDQNTNAETRPRAACRSKSYYREAFESNRKPEDRSDPIAGRNDKSDEIESNQENCESQERRERPFRCDFSEIMDLLEAMGFLNSAGGTDAHITTETSGDSGSGATTSGLSGEQLNRLAAFLSSDMASDLQNLRQLMVKFLDAKMPMQSGGNPTDALTLNAASKLTEFAQLITSLNNGDGNHNVGDSGNATATVSGDRPSEAVTAMSRVVSELVNMTGDTESNKSTENFKTATQSEYQLKAETGKSLPETQMNGTDVGRNVKEFAASSMASTDRASSEENADTADKSRLAGSGGHQNSNAAAMVLGTRNGSEQAQQNRTADESVQLSKIVDEVHGSKDSARGERHAGETALENFSDPEASTVSRVIKEAQGNKDPLMRSVVTMSDDAGSKINPSDSSNNFNGLFNSESHNAEKALENISSSKESQNGQSVLKAQTLDQIVQKAVIHLRNGQHEARIHLKPDYLGQLRMQVITENQQVVVKILAEFPFVKELIEENAHQLKADLQQQGLSVDKLEVSVSRDSEEHRHLQEKAERLKARNNNAGRDDAPDSKEEKRTHTGPARNTAAGDNAVDYFA